MSSTAGERLIQPYETVCICHGDDFHTESFRLEHEACHYKQLYDVKNKEYQRLYRLIEYYNGDPVLMTIRDRELRKRHQWCTDKENELEAKDLSIRNREQEVARREAAVREREQKVQQREQRFVGRITAGED